MLTILILLTINYEDNNDDYCNIVSGGAIVLYYCGFDKVIIDSCTIVNNSRGFVINGYLQAIDIYNTTIINKNNSKLVSDFDDILMVNMFNTVMSDNITIFVPNTEMNIQDTFDGYQMWNHYVAIITRFTDSKRKQHYLITLDEWDSHKCVSLSKCFNNGFYTGYCPVSYSNGNYHSCFDDHNGTLCGKCINGYSIAINSPYLSCVDCSSSH